MNNYRYSRFFMPFFLCFLLVWLTLNSLTEVERVAQLKQGKATQGEVLSVNKENPSPTSEAKHKQSRNILGTTTQPTPQPSSSSSQGEQIITPEYIFPTPSPIATTKANPTPISTLAPTPQPHLPPKADEPIFCIQVITHACLVNESEQVSECRDFPTPCDVPPNWQIQQPNITF